jgi:iron(III) transport system ATP-binding protein
MPDEEPGAGDVSLRTSGIERTFGAEEVLRGIDLVAASGEVVALLGESGSGKTTLLRCIAGLDRPDAGTVEVGRRCVVGPGLDVPTERRGIGMVFQDGALFPHLDVGTNVGYGLPRGERRGPRVGEMLELVGLAGAERRMPDTLSGGQRQRVALARALAPRPGLLLLDEPFSNLDASLRARLRAEVRSLLVDLGITSLFVTHDQEEAFLLGDSLAVIRDGRIAQQASPRDVPAARRPVGGGVRGRRQPAGGRRPPRGRRDRARAGRARRHRPPRTGHGPRPPRGRRDPRRRGRRRG